MCLISKIILQAVELQPHSLNLHDGPCIDYMVLLLLLHSNMECKTGSLVVESQVCIALQCMDQWGLVFLDMQKPHPL